MNFSFKRFFEEDDHMDTMKKVFNVDMAQQLPKLDSVVVANIQLGDKWYNIVTLKVHSINDKYAVVSVSDDDNPYLAQQAVNMGSNTEVRPDAGKKFVISRKEFDQNMLGQGWQAATAGMAQGGMGGIV